MRERRNHHNPTLKDEQCLYNYEEFSRYLGNWIHQFDNWKSERERERDRECWFLLSTLFRSGSENPKNCFLFLFGKWKEDYRELRVTARDWDLGACAPHVHWSPNSLRDPFFFKKTDAFARIKYLSEINLWI